MKIKSLSSMVCVLVLALGVCVFAGSQQAGRPHPEGKRFIGTVLSADHRTSRLVVGSWRGETVFDVSAARFFGPGGFEDIEPGDRVMIRYVEDSGKKVALAVMEAAEKQQGNEKTGSSLPERR
jgi:hypothetical protein